MKCLLFIYLIIFGLTPTATTPTTHPASTWNEIKFTILEPQPNRIMTGNFQVKVEVASLYELTGVTARIGGMETLLKYNACLTFIGRTCYGGYDGTISTAHLPYGTQQLIFSARDVFGTTGRVETMLTIDRAPVVRMTSPLAGAVAHPTVKVEATCTDDDPDPCSVLIVSYGTTQLLRGSISINTEISLAQFQGQSESLCVTAQDTVGSNRVCQQVYVETNRKLREVFSRPGGTILDIKDDRVLIYEPGGAAGNGGVLRIYYRSTGIMRDIASNYQTGPLQFEPNASCNYLTETGAVFLTPGASRPLIQAWQNDRVTTIGQVAGNGVCSVNGRHISWSGTEVNGTANTTRGLMLFDLTTGATTRIADETSIWQFSTGQNGSVAYWLNNQVHRYADGRSIQLNTGSASTPQADGDAVIYKGPGGLTLWTPTGTQVVSLMGPSTIDNRHYYYLIRNGWTAFPRPGSNGATQVWVRNITTGVEAQQHYLQGTSYPDSLSPAGRISFILLKNEQIAESKRYVPVGGKGIEVGSTLGRPFWVDERLYIAIGGTLFLFTLETDPTSPSPAPILATISPASAVAGSTGLTLTVTGTGFTAGSVVRWNGVNRPTTYVDGTRLRATITGADLTATGSAEVTVYVPESGGLVTTPATFTIEGNPRIVRANSGGGSAGGTVRVTIEIEAQGDEAAIGFSLVYDPSILGQPAVALGSDATGASLTVNQGPAVGGQVGVLIGLPIGDRLTAGRRQMAVITFQVYPTAGSATTRLDFGDQPVSRELIDSRAQRLTVAFSGTVIGIGLGLEGDVAPRPLGSGTLTAADWVQIGRMVAGVDLSTEGGEMMRADTAPRATLGDGTLSLADWVQAARYAAQLDPPTAAGGPAVATGSRNPGNGNSPLALESAPPASRVRLLKSAGNVWIVELESQGSENAASFSLRFDDRRWSFEKIEPGADAAEAALQINQLGIGHGELGVMLALPAGQTFTTGRRELLRITLGARTLNEVATVDLNFADLPIRREVIGMAANPLPANFVVRQADREVKMATLVSAANYRGQELARGSIASIFGESLASSTQSAETRPLPLTLGGARVEITDTLGASLPATIFYASPGQLNLLLPESLASGMATVLISNEDGALSVATISVRDTAPSIFTANGDGGGIAAAQTVRIGPDGLPSYGEVFQFEPALGRFIARAIDLSREDEEVFLVLFATGLRFRTGNSPVTVKIGTTILTASFAGAQGTFAGLDQVNVALPHSLRGLGETSVTIIVDGRESTPVRVSIQ